MSVVYSLETAIEFGVWQRVQHEYKNTNGQMERLEYFEMPDYGVRDRTLFTQNDSATKLDAIHSLIKSLETLLDKPRMLVKYKVDVPAGKSFMSAGWSNPRNALVKLYELSAKG